MEKQVIVPAQIRAGRALIDWSQEQLAQAAEIGISAVRDFEGMRRGESVGAAVAMRRALESQGVVFVSADEVGGPGVRLAGRMPNIIRRPTKMHPEHNYLPFAVEWQGRRYFVTVSRDALDDLDRANHKTDVEFVASFERHKAAILKAAAAAISEGKVRVTPDCWVYLSGEDFPELR